MEDSQSRLPVTIKSTGKGQYNYQVSSGGLNTGLNALKKR